MNLATYVRNFFFEATFYMRLEHHRDGIRRFGIAEGYADADIQALMAIHCLRAFHTEKGSEPPDKILERFADAAEDLIPELPTIEDRFPGEKKVLEDLARNPGYAESMMHLYRKEIIPYLSL